jgi:citrate lyase beta subunit
MLDPSFADRLDAALTADDAIRLRRYPGARAGRQPVHTAYVPADRFSAGTAAEWGAAALAALDEHGPLPGFDAAIDRLVRRKLAGEPIEDLRIDFEDGYGTRPDEDEDEDVRAAARGVAATATGAAPSFIGLRMKSLEGPARRRAVRTLDLFLATAAADAPLPGGFRVTLPKVTSVRQVEVMAELCAALEAEYGLEPLSLELQVETPQAVLGADGTALVAPMLHAAAGRCVGLHYGVYDYTAAVGVAAAYQSMEHPAADYAKAVMQAAAAGTGVVVSDGSTNVLPVGGRAAVHAAWELHARLVRRSLERGFYQGWDMHPAQLPTRYAATFAFYRDGFPAAAGRLRAYLARASSGTLDEPATARALAGFLWRGVACGAVSDAGLERRAGLKRADLAELMAGRAPTHAETS